MGIYTVAVISMGVVVSWGGFSANQALFLALITFVFFGWMVGSSANNLVFQRARMDIEETLSGSGSEEQKNLQLMDRGEGNVSVLVVSIAVNVFIVVLKMVN